MVSYPYDWKGTSPANAFKEERIITNEKTDDRVVILKNRPFFEVSLVVTASGSTTPLTRGVDYEITYQMPELNESVATPVACGIQLINPKIGGSLTFVGQALGDTFYSPFIDILDELIKYLNNPVDADWFKVDNRPTFFPPKPAATSWHDLLNKKYVASAVHDVELDSEAANNAVKAKLAALKVTVAGLAKEITTFNYPAHIAAHNPHGTTSAQANAHPANLKTPDTFLAYGKTLRTLTAEIRALGLQQSDIDKYIEKWACKDVSGVFIQQLAANRSLFKSKSGTSEITFTDTAFTIKSNGAVILAAGYDANDTTTRFMEWTSGTNTLRIESSGNALGMDKLTLNGKVLLTTTLLMKYQPTESGQTSDPDDQKIYVQGRGGISVTGKGSKADPVKASLTLPSATTTVKGTAVLKSGVGDEVSGVASTPDSLQPYEGKASGYVAKTTMLNSKPMDDGARVMTKSDIGLSQADNTADVNKPVSADQSTAMDGLSDKGHKHTFASLNLPLATNATEGLGRYTDLDDGLSGSKGVTPNVMKRLSDRLDAISDALKSVKTGVSTDFSIIDASTWSVASGRILQVKDLQYFYLRGNDRAEGKVSGSINLETTPMFNWFSPNNTMERNWTPAVKNTAANFDFSAISSKPNFALKATPIGLSANGMGNLSVISLLSKLRLKSYTGTLRLYIVAGGKVTVYLDGQEVGTGNSPFFLEVDVDSAKQSACLGIRADCNDATKAAAMAFEVYDESLPIYRSDVGTPITQLGEFMTPTFGNRHFLYLNMVTQSMYSRAEPQPTNEVSPETALIGVVDVPAGGITTPTVSFPMMRDYGISNEASDHIASLQQHIPAARDWTLTDNLAMLPIGKLRFNSPSALYGEVTAGAETVYGLAQMSRNSTTKKAYMLLETTEQTPQWWFTPSNPKANGAPTFQGGLVYEEYQTNGLFAQPLPALLFASPTLGSVPADYRNRYLRVPLDGVTEPDYGYVNAIATHAGVNTTLPTFESNILYSKTTSLRKNEASAVLGVMDLTTLKAGSPRLAVRYSYNVTLRKLSVFSVYFAGNPNDVDGSLLINELEIQFDVDVRGLMGGFVGLELPPLGGGTSVCSLLGSVAPLDGIGFVEDAYQYLRSLFESYADSGVLPNTSVKNATVVLPAGVFVPDVRYTEYQLVPMGCRSFHASHAGYLPLAFNRDALLQSVHSVDTNGNWFGKPGSSDGTNFLISGMLVEYNLPQSSKVAKLKIVKGTQANAVRQLAIGGQVINVAYASSLGGELGVPVPARRGDLKLQLAYLPGYTSDPLKLEFTYELYDAGGTLLTTITENTVADAMWFVADRYTAKRINPLHMTTRLWNVLQAKMDAERTTDGTDFGQWV
ncbi:putative virion structural protein [Erwinia phage vB_EamM_Huxley]|uniref:Putative virion structural protein n=1 Tax=Erwinia phage vB_EamM_Huxley TaxID=1883373 RepID=A0A1B2IDE6_9CAUD|nr:virion structural protein [Erwinia phage vB_EamM_Huxley]ANZ49262.1 putative virion structural protein [Erwinia phage vB_EamM_Huxley]